jgi:DUF4097 and DUF4098 domain-containing protein YvlB
MQKRSKSVKGRYYPYVFVLVLAVTAISAGYAVSDEDVSKTFSVTSGKKLDINLKCGGGVYVKGWDENKVEVNYYEDHGDLEDLDIDIKETRSGIKITADFASRHTHSTSLQFVIKVPRRFDVEMSTAGGGMAFSGFEGTIEGRSNGGGIELDDMQGQVDLKTNGGGIEITDCDLDGKVRTNGGGIDLENVTGRLRLRTGGGGLRFENVRFASDTAPVTTGGGGIDVISAPEGVAATTGGGRIDVSHAAKFVELRTGGGDIDIHMQYGRVEASTGAGDIDVVVDRSPGELDGGIEIGTGTGDVRVMLPADFSADFDIDLGYTKDSRRDFEIKCDFDIKLEHTDEWEYDGGSPKKHIYGTGTIKNGKHKIKIRTTNGDVRIIKK